MTFSEKNDEEILKICLATSLSTISLIENEYSAFISIVNFDWHDLSKWKCYFKNTENCMEATDPHPKGFAMCL